MKEKTRSILRGQFLKGVIFVLICPITDGLDQNPIDFIALGCCVDPCSLHFPTNGFRLDTEEFVAKNSAADKFITRKHESKMNFWLVPIKDARSQEAQ